MIRGLVLAALHTVAWASAGGAQTPLLPNAFPSDVADLTQALVGIESTSLHEINATAYVAAYIESQLPYDVTWLQVDTNRFSLYATARGTSQKPRVLMTSHLDTVPPFLTVRRDETTIYGRGACDAKGSVAAQLVALRELLDSGTVAAEDVALAYVVGEEVAGDGMKRLAEEGHTWEAVLFAEPTEGRLARGHKGVMGLEITVEGRASHSGYPELGISATEALIDVLQALRNVEFPTSSTLGPCTMNIAMLDAGVAANVVPAHARASISIRVSTEPEVVRSRVTHAIESYQGPANVSYAFNKHVIPQPMYLDYDIPGFETSVEAYATDIIYLPGEHKRYLYGPGSIQYAHGDDEHVTEAELRDAVKGNKRIIEHLLA